MCRKNQCYINTVQVLIVGFAIEASRLVNYDKKESLLGTILTLLFAERGDLLRAANLVCSTCGSLPAFLLRCVRYRGCPLLLLLLRLCAKKKKKAKTVLKALVVSPALRNQPGGPIIPSYTLPGREPSRPFRESQGESLL